MTATTTATLELADDGATVTVTVQVRLCGKPRKTMPPRPVPRIVETTATPVEDWSNVIALAPRQVA